jgi:DNA-binding transcriptional LysR family regulator
MNVQDFDLNLIPVFLAIARHGNVTQAALELGLTQSTVSHSLARLRTVCNDQLFVRTGTGMLPTAAASAMIHPLEQALKAMHSSLLGVKGFEPGSAKRSFTLLLSDIGQLTHLPMLVDHLRSTAPGVTINVLQLPIGEYRNALAVGGADLAIGHLPNLQSGFHQIALFDDPYVCMLRADHPRIKNAISFEDYLESSHVVVEPSGRGPGLVEQALSRLKKTRSVVLRLPHFYAGPLILRRTDYLMTVPRFTQLALSDLVNIRFVPLPFKVEQMQVKVLWHERMHHDPGHQWLRGAIAKLVAKCGPSGHRLNQTKKAPGPKAQEAAEPL